MGHAPRPPSIPRESSIRSRSRRIALRYAEHFSDEVILQAADEVDALTTGLSREIRRKIMTLQAAGRRGLPT